MSAAKTSSGLGKRQVLLSFNPGKAFVISVDVGLATTIVARVDLSINVTDKCEIGTSESPEKFACELVDCISDLCDKGNELPSYLVISVPGLVRGDLRTAINVPLLHWVDLPLAEVVENRLKLKGIETTVTINNDAKLGVLAEVALNQDISDRFKEYSLCSCERGGRNRPVYQWQSVCRQQSYCWRIWVHVYRSKRTGMFMWKKGLLAYYGWLERT